MEITYNGGGTSQNCMAAIIADAKGCQGVQGSILHTQLLDRLCCPSSMVLLHFVFVHQTRHRSLMQKSTRPACKSLDRCLESAHLTDVEFAAYSLP